jgi:hypothetical protein
LVFDREADGSGGAGKADRELAAGEGAAGVLDGVGRELAGQEEHGVSLVAGGEQGFDPAADLADLGGSAGEGARPEESRCFVVYRCVCHVRPR